MPQIKTITIKILSYIIIVVMSTILFFSCADNAKSAKNSFNESTDISKTLVDNKNVAIQVQMEGKTHTILQRDLNPNRITFENDSLQFVFYTNEHPFKVNFNLNNTDIINKGTASYNIPEANALKTKVDLSFFNNAREVKSMNKRIIFRKGTISISKLSNRQLQMTFEGEGSGVMEYGKNFPISGKVNVNY